jgi:hypothetical protein
MGEHRRRIGFQDRAIQQPALAELSDAVANHLWPKLPGVALRREGLDASCPHSTGCEGSSSRSIDHLKFHSAPCC